MNQNLALNRFRESCAYRRTKVAGAINQWYAQKPQMICFYLQAFFNEDSELQDFVFTDVNEAFCLMVGKTSHELLGKGLQEALAITTRHPFYQKYLKVHVTDQAFTEMIPSPFKAKSWISHQVTKVGEQLSTQIQWIDLEQQFNKDQKATSEKMAQELIQQVSLSGEILTMNNLSEKYFEECYQRKQVLTMDDILHPVSKLAYRMAIKRVISHRVETELPLIFKTNDQRLLKTVGTLVPNYANQKIQSICQTFKINKVGENLREVSIYRKNEAFKAF